MKNSCLIRHEMTVQDIRKLGAYVKLFGSREHVVDGKYLVQQEYGIRVKIGELYSQIRHVKDQRGRIIAKRLRPGGKLYFNRRALVSINAQPFNSDKEIG